MAGIRHEILSPSARALGLPAISHSLRVHAADFREEWLTLAAAQLCHPQPPPVHRKLWEHAVVLHVYRTLQAARQLPVRPRVLGFGVGQEPLPSWFAAHGASVLATDKAAGTSNPGWAATGQHASSVADLPRLSYVSPEEMAAAVSFCAIDMADLPSSLLHGERDMIWSCGSSEHIGGVETSLAFFARAMAALRPGGVAVHTTEYEYSHAPGLPVLDTPDLVLFRDEHLSDLADRLFAQGDTLLPLDAAPGDEPADLYVDRPPYTHNPHLCVEVCGGRLTTSIALIAVRGER